jgi:hypothetical protein
LFREHSRPTSAATSKTRAPILPAIVVAIDFVLDTYDGGI